MTTQSQTQRKNLPDSLSSYYILLDKEEKLYQRGFDLLLSVKKSREGILKAIEVLDKKYQQQRDEQEQEWKQAMKEARSEPCLTGKCYDLRFYLVRKLLH